MSTLEVAVPREGMRARIRDFFYSSEVPYGVALMRIVLSITLLFVMVPRWSFARELFSTDERADHAVGRVQHASLDSEPVRSRGRRRQ